MHTVEALLRIHHIAKGLDDENICEHATADVHVPAGPYSHRVPSPRFRTTVPVMPPSVRLIWPLVTHSLSAMSPADARRLEHEDNVRDRYNFMNVKNMGKLVLPLVSHTIPENTSWRTRFFSPCGLSNNTF